MKTAYLAAAALAAPIALAQPALAAPGDPVKLDGGLTFDPIIDGRLRFESVDQPATDAEALTLRIRAGAELKHSSGLSMLFESEGTLAIADDYNAFPFPVSSSQRRTQYSVVADPMNVELNRLQIQYKSKKATVTLGRQRINLDDQRWVGGVAWRQNEQTFDAVRGEFTLGPVGLDAIYSNGQRTLFGFDAQARSEYEGDFVLLGASAKTGPVQVKAFTYLLDYDEGFFAANSSQTYGARAVAALPLPGKNKLTLTASYARQSDYGSNPFDYSADYIAGEAALGVKMFTLTAGYEKLGSDNGRAVQTPMATLHKFNGWADLFLTTPASGLEDIYGGVAAKFDKVKALPGLNAQVTYHTFQSDVGGLDFGSEWDASLGFKLGRTSLLAKFADYQAKGFGVDTQKLWLQLEFSY